jgi:toxin ParE1/3/4
VSARVLSTVQAAEDLEDIWLNVAVDNVDAADKLLDTVGAAAALLAKQPLMGRARPELANDLRSWPVGRYLLFYLPLRDGIEVVRVLHGARDLAPDDFS